MVGVASALPRQSLRNILAIRLDAKGERLSSSGLYRSQLIFLKTLQVQIPERTTPRWDAVSYNIMQEHQQAFVYSLFDVRAVLNCGIQGNADSPPRGRS